MHLKQAFTCFFLLLFGFAASTALARDDKGKNKDTVKHARQHERVAVKPGNDNIKHKGIDRNNDGIITRAEWRGNDNSFRKHDLNGDGVLSGDEVTPGARREDRRDEKGDRREGRFLDADHNRDGVITRDEWHGNSREFERLDINGDGKISQDEFSGRRVDSREARFRDLDHNNDGTISRNEWHGDASSFDRLDENRDGIISRDEFLRHKK